MIPEAANLTDSDRFIESQCDHVFLLFHHQALHCDVTTALF